MIRPAPLLFVLSLAACPRPATAPAVAPGPAVPPTPSAAEVAMTPFEATLRIDPEPRENQFQGVWLDRADRDPLLVSYRAETCWTPFDGHRVTVTGEPWWPSSEVQHVMADHFHVASLALAEPDAAADVAIHAVGPERLLHGVIETLAGEPGTKMEGSTWPVFVAEEDGVAYQIWDSPASVPEGPRIAVAARTVEVSPFTTHMPGPTLWIRAVTPVDPSE